MGLVNLRGSILPVASVQALLGREEGAATSDLSPHRPRRIIDYRAGSGRSLNSSPGCIRKC